MKMKGLPPLPAMDPKSKIGVHLGYGIWRAFLPNGGLSVLQIGPFRLTRVSCSPRDRHVGARGGEGSEWGVKKTLVRERQVGPAGGRLG